MKLGPKQNASFQSLEIFKFVFVKVIETGNLSFNTCNISEKLLYLHFVALSNVSSNYVRNT